MPHEIINRTAHYYKIFSSANNTGDNPGKYCSDLSSVIYAYFFFPFFIILVSITFTTLGNASICCQDSLSTWLHITLEYKMQVNNCCNILPQHFFTLQPVFCAINIAHADKMNYHWQSLGFISKQCFQVFDPETVVFNWLWVWRQNPPAFSDVEKHNSSSLTEVKAGRGDLRISWFLTSSKWRELSSQCALIQITIPPPRQEKNRLPNLIQHWWILQKKNICVTVSCC